MAFIMSSAQNAQALPSFKLALQSDHYNTILPNLSYPSRHIADIPWSGSSAPLLFSKTTRSEPTVASNTNVPITANICFDTSSVSDGFHGIIVFIQHHFSVIVEKLKLINQKVFGVRTSVSVTASV